MIYYLLEIIPFTFRLYNKSYDSAILYFKAINRGSAHAFPALGPSRLAGRFKRGIKPYTFSIVLQMIRIIRVICEIYGLKRGNSLDLSFLFNNIPHNS
jgi:hypothetical protein